MLTERSCFSYYDDLAMAFTGVIRLGSLGLLLLEGCGGRTSLLDPSGGTATGGASALSGEVTSRAGNAIGGAVQIGAPGAAGASGAAVIEPLDPASAACTTYCSALYSSCARAQNSATCVSDCVAELAAQHGECTDLGLQMLACLAKPPVNPESNLCLSSFRSRVAACSPEIRLFQVCASDNPHVIPHAAICAQYGGPTSVGCTRVMLCTDRRFYELSCHDTTAGHSSCTCREHGFNGKLELNESVAHACEDNIAQCFALAAESGPPPQ